MRWRVLPKCSEIGLVALSTLIAISVGAGTARAWTACATLTVMGLLLGFFILQECEAATALTLRAIQEQGIAQSSAQLVSGHFRGITHAALQPMASCVPMTRPIVEGKD